MAVLVLSGPENGSSPVLPRHAWHPQPALMLAAGCAFLQSLYTVFLQQKQALCLAVASCHTAHMQRALCVVDLGGAPAPYQAVAFSIPTCHLHPETWVLDDAQELQWQHPQVNPVLPSQLIWP